MVSMTPEEAKLVAAFATSQAMTVATCLRVITVQAAQAARATGTIRK
jgi:hypothetical protein